MSRTLRPNPWFPILVILATAGCGPSTRQDEFVAANNGRDAVQEAPTVPLTTTALDRAGFLAAVATAASAAAAGTDAATTQRELDGRQFELHIRFGCRGPAGADDDDRWLGWSIDAAKGRLSVHARPTISAEETLIQRLNAGEFEAVEGFWIPRPWLLNAQCPAGLKHSLAAPSAEVAEREDERSSGLDSAVADDPASRAPRIGIAQFFAETDARPGRRKSRPYQSVTTIEGVDRVGAEGFDLVLSGRLRARPGMGVIGCAARDPDSPPECIASAEFDKVWIEDPQSGDTIAQWTSG